MWTLPIVICSQNSFRLIHKRIIFNTNFLRCHSKFAKSKVKKTLTSSGNLLKNPVVDERLKLAVSLINEYSEPESIRWDELINKLKDSQISNTRSAILQACLTSTNPEAGLSYYNYLVKNNEKLTLLDYTIFSKLFIQKESILKNEVLVENLYNILKNHMTESSTIQQFVVKLVAEIPRLFFDFVERTEGKIFTSGEFMLIKALDYDRIDMLTKFLEDYEPRFNKNFINAYLNFLIRRAAKHEFLPYFVTTLTDICEKNVSTFVCSDFYPLVTYFVESVNQYQNDFIWSTSECLITERNICTDCGLKLLDKPLSDTEFKILQENCFLNIGLLNKNIFLSSSEKEFRSFLSFLNTCKPYDVVLDFLNLFYQMKQFKVEIFESIVKYLLNEGHSILIIGKKHIKSDLLNKYISKYRQYKDKVQYFFADNMSDDDVFLLYAAMYNGPKYIISGDYFKHYVPHLENNYKNLFLRWKIYHQYIAYKGKIIPPCSHLGVPQLTTTPDENGQMFVWHLSYKPDNSSRKLNANAELKWVCLKAVKK